MPFCTRVVPGSRPRVRVSSFVLSLGSIIRSYVRGVACSGGGWEAYVHTDAFWGVFAGVDLGEAVEVARGGVIGVRDEQGQPLPVCGNGGVDLLQERLAAFEGAYHRRLRVPPA